MESPAELARLEMDKASDKMDYELWRALFALENSAMWLASLLRRGT